jgi:hypothetical protein
MYKLLRAVFLIVFSGFTDQNLICAAALPGDSIKPVSVEFDVSDASDGQRTACRIHIQNHEGKRVRPTGLMQPYWHDHFVCDGNATFLLPPGEYRYEAERGPEYLSARDTFVVNSDTVTRIPVSLKRLVKLTDEGWWSGETHVHRPLKEVPLLMSAEDLHVASVITWWNDQNSWQNQSVPAEAVSVVDGDRVFDAMGGEDERGGGALLFSGLKSPLPIAGSAREFPTSLHWLNEAKQQGAWIDAEKPFWWDFPVWLSTGQLDSIGIANNHMNRSQMYPNEAWGKARNLDEFPEPLGNGFWTQSIYYHALNAGFRIPPSAGSASGVLPNPVGYNRMYAQLDGEFSHAAWWKAVKAGRVFVTNGPLPRLKAGGFDPGHVFQSDQPIDLIVDGPITSRDTITAIELVRDGRVERLTSLPATIRIERSGWFLVRVLTDVAHTFRFASTAPWYVEVGGRPHPVRRTSCEFFQRWTEERIEQLHQKVVTDSQRQQVLPVFENAARFWADRAAAATAE